MSPRNRSAPKHTRGCTAQTGVREAREQVWPSSLGHMHASCPMRGLPQLRTWPQWAVLDWNQEASRQAPAQSVWPVMRRVARYTV